MCATTIVWIFLLTGLCPFGGPVFNYCPFFLLLMSLQALLENLSSDEFSEDEDTQNTIRKKKKGNIEG